MSSDWSDEEREIITGLTRHARRPWKLLKKRGQDEKAAELASLSPSEQKRFVKNEFRDYDPELDRPANQEYMKIKNAYDALRELGHDDHAEELREFVSSGRQLKRAKEIIASLGAEVDLISGEIDRSEVDEQDSGAQEA